MFSVPRGYSDGFQQLVQADFRFVSDCVFTDQSAVLGLLTWQTNRLLGLGIMLSANEVPRIAQHFGLDTSVRVNMTSVSHTVNTAVRAGQFVAKKLA